MLVERASRVGVEIPCHVREDMRQCRLRRRRSILVAEVTHDTDAGAAVGVLVGVATDHVRAAHAPLEDVAPHIDEVVVPNVAPPLRDAVVVVDRPHGVVAVRAVIHRSMVDDRVLHRLVFGRPDFLAVLEPERLVRAPLGSRDDRRRHIGIRVDRRRRRGSHDRIAAVGLPWSVRRIDVRELEAVEHNSVVLGVANTIANVLLTVGEEEIGVDTAVSRHGTTIVPAYQREDIAPGFAVRADLHVHRGPPAHATIPPDANRPEREFGLERHPAVAGQHGAGTDVLLREPVSRAGSVDLLGLRQVWPDRRCRCRSASHESCGQTRGGLHHDTAIQRPTRYVSIPSADRLGSPGMLVRRHGAVALLGGTVSHGTHARRAHESPGSRRVRSTISRILHQRQTPPLRLSSATGVWCVPFTANPASRHERWSASLR